MARRPGMVELAQAAGVSVATVDRVLNGREKVKPDTVARVHDAALRIGHPAARRIAPLAADLPELRFGVVLHKQGQEFYKAFAEALHRAVAELPGVRGRLLLEFSASQAPSEMAGLLRSMAGRCDVLAATAVNHPEVTAAVEELHGQGLAVFSLLSDFAQGARAGYLGLNNLKVGRTAAWMMSLAAPEPGKVAVFVGGHRWHGHDLRETGFRAYLRESAPQLAVLEPLVNLETRQLTYEATLGLLARQPDLRGVYVAGGGMEGAIAALREAGAGTGGRAGRQVALIVSALTPESRAGLAEGVVTLVIDTPLDKLCRALMAQMRDTVQAGAPPNGVQIFLPPDLHVAESI
ncbi:transcriptional regulator, LacI family [Gemmobacter aquatilis]|uniref:Transcriptional regulator, LacI family n=1 Tax=Gemmobacter aquatilis TaxID=933059 RepID=A0A1H8KN61_9RHOB|nr:LacI family DNA-binding transcriptional regulator [Gemmobacter aquatilis]SEN94325.1 transcriptional regulator, LacI family [Gemmobacter aquatilis]